MGLDLGFTDVHFLRTDFARCDLQQMAGVSGIKREIQQRSSGEIRQMKGPIHFLKAGFIYTLNNELRRMKKSYRRPNEINHLRPVRSWRHCAAVNG
jgi:hypothetical protein